MKGRAIAHGAVSIVNAISIGKGAALGVNLSTEAEVELEPKSGKSNIQCDVSNADCSFFTEAVVREVLSKYSRSGYNIVVKTKSQIPVARGLKSSSAASNALVLATLSALNQTEDDLRIINLGVNASLKAGVTITGAFDDASASFFGGLVVTDNNARRIIRMEPAPDDIIVIIYIPKNRMFTKDFDRSRIMPFKQEVSEAFELALEGDYWKAMTLNGQIHSNALGLTLNPAQDALESGALAAGLSGTGPAVAAVCRQNVAEEIKVRWRKLSGKTLVTSVNNSKACRIC